MPKRPKVAASDDVPLPDDVGTSEPAKPRGKLPHAFRKNCRACHVLKRREEFDVTGDGQGRRSSVCKACIAIAKGVSVGDINTHYIINCLHCGKPSPMTAQEVSRIVKEAIITEERLDPDAPIRAILAGALGEGGATSLGRSLRKKIVNPETPTTERMRCYELLINCMKHFENSQPPPADLSRLDKNELESMLSRIMRGQVGGGPVGAPAWMKKPEVAADAQQPTTETTQ